MLATSTHDNKRSEDVRARIDVISEMPDAWRTHVRRWSRMNRARKREVDGVTAPSRNDEYLLYQTLAGSFPTGELDEQGLANYRQRVEQYMLKAVREAKVNTSWVNNNEAYESAVVQFVQALLSDSGSNLFLEEFRGVARHTAWLGMLNSLSMTLLKLTSPGVPDIYQGNELWDFSLADPDNRRPVDYALRQRLLAELDVPQLEQLFAEPGDGRAKLHFLKQLLALRKARPALFLHGGYTPLQAKGEHAGNIMAYDIETQCRGVFENVRLVLEDAGATWNDIVDVTVFLTNMKKDFPAYNKLYAEYFAGDGKPNPTRTTVEVTALPTPIAIELKVIAVVG